MQTRVCTASVGPGSTNMLTGAALATINRLPVLLLPSGTFHPPLRAGAAGARDAVRRRRHRQRRLPAAVPVLRPSPGPSSCRRRCWRRCVLTDPAETGAVTVALPRTSRPRRTTGRWSCSPTGPGTWRAHRPSRPHRRGRRADPLRTPTLRRRRRRALLRRRGRLQALCEATGIPVGESQAGKGSAARTPRRWARSAPRGPRPPTPWPARPTWSSGSAPAGATSPPRRARRSRPGSPVRQHQHRRLRRGQARRPVRGRRRARGPDRLTAALDGYAVDDGYRAEQAELWREWDARAEAAYHPPAEVTDALADGLLTQGTVIGCVNELSDPRDVVICAPGRCRRPAQAVAGARPQGLPRRVRLLLHGLRGARLARGPLADPTRDVFAMVGDVPDDADRAGDRGPGGDQGDRRARPEPRVPLDRVAVRGARLPAVRDQVPLPRPGDRAARRRRAAGGSRGQRPQPGGPGDRGDLARRPREGDPAGEGGTGDAGPILIHVQTDPLVHAPDSESWWDVPVSQVADRVHPRGVRPLPRPSARSEDVPAPTTPNTRRRSRASPPSSAAPRQLGGLVRRRPGPGALAALPRRGRRRRLHPHRARPVRLPADRSRSAHRRGREARPDRHGRHDLRAPAPGGLVGHHLGRRLRRRGAHRGHGRQARRRDPGLLARPGHRQGARAVRAHGRGAEYATQINRLARAIRDDYGLQIQFHPHADSHVDTHANVERFYETDPDLVTLCLDTGHIEYCEGDSPGRSRTTRSGSATCTSSRSTRRSLAKVRAEEIGFGEAVKMGAMRAAAGPARCPRSSTPWPSSTTSSCSRSSSRTCTLRTRRAAAHRHPHPRLPAVLRTAGLTSGRGMPQNVAAGQAPVRSRASSASA